MSLFSVVGNAIQSGIDSGIAFASTVVIETTDTRYDEIRNNATIVSHGSKAISALCGIAGIGTIILGVKSEKKVGAMYLCAGTVASWISYNGYHLSNNFKTIVDNPGAYYNVFT